MDDGRAEEQEVRRTAQESHLLLLPGILWTRAHEPDQTIPDPLT